MLTSMLVVPLSAVALVLAAASLRARTPQSARDFWDHQAGINAAVTG
jgi:hypothetical protein